MIKKKKQRCRLDFFVHYQVPDLSHHTQDLGGSFVFDTTVDFAESQGNNRCFLVFGAFDGAAHLGNFYLCHELIGKGLSIKNFFE